MCIVPSFYIPFTITYHKGQAKIYIKIFCSTQQQPRFRFATVTVNLIFRPLTFKAFVGMVRADINTIKVCSLFTEKSLHLTMYFIKFIPRHLSTCNDRLISYHDSKITALIDFFDCLCYPFNKFKIIYITKETYIFVDGSISIQENGFLLVIEILASTIPALKSAST